MHPRFLVVPILLALAAGLAQADVIVNDRALDSPGTFQYGPHLGLVTTTMANRHLVCEWEQRLGNTREYRVAVSTAVSASPTTYTWVQHGAPPAPAGYQWNSDLMLKAPSSSVDNSGTFLIFGQVLSVAGPPYTVGMASVRGHVADQNTLNWDTPQLVETFGTQTTTTRYIGAMTMNADQTNSAAVYVAYVTLNTQTPTLGSWFRKSTDFGTTWSAPISFGFDTTVSAQVVPTFQCGAYGDVDMFWLAPSGADYQIMERASANGGNTFGAPVPVIYQVTPDMTSPFGLRGFFGPLTTATDLYGPTYGFQYFAASDEIYHSFYTFPDPSTSPSTIEVEPNNRWYQATPCPVGAVFRGFFPTGSPPDTDVFSLTLSAGQTVMAQVDSFATGAASSQTWYGPDGASLLMVGGGRVEFTAPVAGTYYVQLARTSAGGGGYRVRTMTATVPGGVSRDQNDVWVVRGVPINPFWSAGANASSYTTPAGYDEDGLTLTANRDGFIYLSWYDWSQVPGGETSRYAVVRSPDGGESWQGPAFLSSSGSDWRGITYPGTSLPFGPWQDMATDGNNVFYVWVDGRNGDGDIYSSAFQRGMSFNSVSPGNTVSPTSYSAHPGDVVHLSCQVHNKDNLWGWNPLMIRAETSYRNWQLAGQNQPLAAGATQTFDYAFTVPDTAAPGDVPIEIHLRSGVYPDGASYDMRITDLTVLPPLAVGAGETKLELAAVSPNPVIERANLAFSLSRAGRARLAIYDVGGRLVRVVEDGVLAAGPHARSWNGANDAGARVGSGAYFVQLEAEGKRLVRRMVWMK